MVRHQRLLIIWLRKTYKRKRTTKIHTIRIVCNYKFPAVIQPLLPAIVCRNFINSVKFHLPEIEAYGKVPGGELHFPRRLPPCLGCWDHACAASWVRSAEVSWAPSHHARVLWGEEISRRNSEASLSLFLSKYLSAVRWRSAHFSALSSVRRMWVLPPLWTTGVNYLLCYRV